jgi:hypothetical protein
MLSWENEIEGGEYLCIKILEVWVLVPGYIK